MKNDQIAKIRKKHFIAPAVTYYRKPLHLVSASGSHVVDDEGKRYLDAIGGIVCISAGHNHPRVKARLMAMLNSDAIQHTSTLYMNAPSAELAEKIVNEAPEGLDRVFFANSGSEANELAFLAARQSTGETTIVNLRHGYHGGTAAALAACGHATWRFRAQPVAQVASAMEPYCYRCPFGKTPTSCALECAKNVEATIQTCTNGKIAGFIAEPVMGAGGFISPPNEYFRAVADIVHNYGGKYISDEVQTGAGRGGENFLMTKDLGIEADIITMAKGFGNGAAIGATLMTDEISDSLAGKTYFSTFGSDPYPAAQAAETMDIIRDEKLIANAKARGTQLQDGLREIMKRRAPIGDVRGRGLIVGMELVKDRATKEPAPEACLAFMEACRERGLLVGRGGLLGNVIRLAPPLSITRDEVDFMLKTIDEGLA